MASDLEAGILIPANSHTAANCPREIRNLSKNHRGRILLPRMDRCAIDVTFMENNNMTTDYGHYLVGE